MAGALEAHELVCTGNVGMGSGDWGHSCLSLLDTPAFSAPPCIWTLPPNAVHLPLDREGEDHLFFTAPASDLALGQNTKWL